MFGKIRLVSTGNWQCQKSEFS